MSSSSVIEVGVAIVSTADNAASIYENPTPINIIAASGQSISGILSLAGPGATFATSPAAAVLTTGKITLDVKNGNSVSPGDILSLTGNTVAIIGAIGIAVGAHVTVPAIALSTLLTILGVSINQNWIPWRDMNNDFMKAKTWQQPRDPIILDLDGNGLTTVGLDANIYFDHDGDGVLTRTGWVGQGDALLVWDRNGNGGIDTGAELFGDFTPLPNGALAPNDFAALAALDANGDGILDASDPAFAELKLWLDTDQNGQTGAGELISLADAGIVSLNLTNSLRNQSLANGNQLAREGSFTRTDGTTSAMGEFNLAINSFRTCFAEVIEIPEELWGLPSINEPGKTYKHCQAHILSMNKSLQEHAAEKHSTNLRVASHSTWLRSA